MTADQLDEMRGRIFDLFADSPETGWMTPDIALPFIDKLISVLVQVIPDDH